MNITHTSANVMFMCYTKRFGHLCIIASLLYSALSNCLLPFPTSFVMLA